MSTSRKIEKNRNSNKTTTKTVDLSSKIEKFEEEPVVEALDKFDIKDSFDVVVNKKEEDLKLKKKIETRRSEDTQHMLSKLKEKLLNGTITDGEANEYKTLLNS